MNLNLQRMLHVGLTKRLPKSIFCSIHVLSKKRCYLSEPDQNYYSSFNNENLKNNKWIILATGFTGVIGISLYLKNNFAEAKEVNKESSSHVEGLPIYTSDNVSKHGTPEQRIWVSFKSGVYDITDFITEHPGGDKILMAAGGSLEPFWELYAVHKTEQVFEILEKYRIGNLNEDDVGQALDNMEDPYAHDPKRHPILKPSSVKPFNAEPPLELLVENFITPNTLFFVRNHLPVPTVDIEDYSLEIEGPGIKPLVLTLEDLKTKFKKHSVISTIQCAGNRRSELNKIKEVKGLNWGAAAISTAKWSGVKLIDVLKYAQVNFENPDYQHVQFEGLDTDPANAPYGASIPAHKAFDPSGDVILAYEMNDEEIPKDHGYPLRAIVPGIVGARNVKWLSRIILSPEESHSHWQRRDYKGFSPSVDWQTVDFDSSPAIQELPVNSVICQPAHGEKVKLVEGEKVKVKGYAWSGGGKKIVRVDVSGDGGKTWMTAHLEQEKSSLHQTWSWTLWEILIPVTEEMKASGKAEFICKAVDASYNVQPETFGPIWNLRGVLGNAWHRLSVYFD